MFQESKGKADALKPSIELIVNNYLNRYTLHSDLMRELIGTLDNVDLKYKGIIISEELINAVIIKPQPKKNRYNSSSTNYNKIRKKNNLAELGLRFYADLHEVEKGIRFYYNYYQENDEEIKLYVLIRILFELRDKENIKKELQMAIDKGIELRNNLKNLLIEIKTNAQLPDYF